jgi:hypothetical protein
MATLAPVKKSQGSLSAFEEIGSSIYMQSSTTTQSPLISGTTGTLSFSLFGKRLDELELEVEAIRELLDSQPKTYNTHLVDLNDERLQLRCPLEVIIESYPDEVIASIPEFNLYSSGPSDAVALANLKREVGSTYIRLNELGFEKLGPLPSGWLVAMNKVIEISHA